MIFNCCFPLLSGMAKHELILVIMFDEWPHHPEA
jgi:hypothetical protein